MRIAVGAGIAAVALAAGLGGTVGSVSAAESVEVPASVEAARIYVRDAGKQSPIHGHTFSFYVYLDVCPTPLLEVDHTTLVERPAIGSDRGAAIVTAYLRWPAHEERQEGEPCPPEAPIMRQVRVRTKRPAADLVFFDGSSSPPRRVFRPHRPPSGG